MKVRIYDTNNWVRIMLENDFAGYGIRSLWNEIKYKNDADLRIFVFEGKNGNAIRRSIYPEYKMKRTPATDTFFENLNFFRELLDFAPENVYTAWCDGYEGDDTIATLCHDLKGCEIEVMSTDRDLTQILNASFPMVKKDLTDRRFIRLYKTLVGDPSDNICGLKGFGLSAWERTRNVWDLLEEFVKGKDVDLNRFDHKTQNILLGADRDLLRKLWEITGFYYIGDKMIKKQGKKDFAEVERRLNEFFI